MPTTNIAVTSLAAFIVTRQWPSTSTEPQPTHSTDSALTGTPVRVTTVPCSKLAPQVPPQVIPPGELVTLPLPTFLTVSSRETSLKVAVTSLAASIVTRHLFSPLTDAQPVQTTAMLLTPGEPVSVTVDFSAKGAEQTPP